MNPKRPTLEERFFDFASKVPGCEIIDQLKLTRPQERAEKADLFLDQRTIVAEVKSLRTDTSEKVERILDPYRDHDDFPVFYGEWPVEEVLSRLRNGAELKREIYKAVTSAIPELVRKANRQIRTTKEKFHKPKAKGVLIILNDFVGILTPEIIAHSVQAALRKTNPNKSLQFSEIVCVWIISETHVIELKPGLRAIPGVVMNHPHIEAPEIEAAIMKLQPLWAQYHNVPLFRVDAEGGFPKLPFHDIEDLRRAQAERIPRHELWRREYRARPYLRPLSKEKLLEYGGRLTWDTGKHFLVGSTSTDDERHQSMIKVTHFFEEIEHRMIDLREMKPYLDRAMEESPHPPSR